MNTREPDMDVIGARAPYVFCRSVANGGSGDPSVHTALGVFHGLRATVERAFGSPELPATDRAGAGRRLGRREAGTAARWTPARPCS